MTHSIELSSQTFSRLQAHAVPLVDSIETVINRILDVYEKSRENAPRMQSIIEAGPARHFSPVTPPDLTYTKILSAELCGVTLERGQSNWNNLLSAAIFEAKRRTRASDD